MEGAVNHRKTLLHTNRHSISVLSKGYFPLSPVEEPRENCAELEIEHRCFFDLIVWLDSFNSLKKCWEPCIEAFTGHCLYEKVGG
jgi:hypothetical protein